MDYTVDHHHGPAERKPKPHPSRDPVDEPIGRRRAEGSVPKPKSKPAKRPTQRPVVKSDPLRNRRRTEGHAPAPTPEVVNVITAPSVTKLQVVEQKFGQIVENGVFETLHT